MRKGVIIAAALTTVLGSRSAPCGEADYPPPPPVPILDVRAPEYHDKVPGYEIDGVWYKLSQQTCGKLASDLRTQARRHRSEITCSNDRYGAAERLLSMAEAWAGQFELICEVWAGQYEAWENDRRAVARARPIRPYPSQQSANSGGAGGSEAVSPQSSPSTIPSGGGAGGSLAQTQAAEAQQQPPPVPNSGGAGGSLAETQGAQPPAAPDKGAERESKLMAGSSSSMVEPYTSQRMPNSGGAGGSQLQQAATPNSGGAGGSEPTTWESQPAYSWSAGPEPSVVPNSGGAGGSEQTRMASASPTQQTQQTCDPKSFGDAQLRLLLANPTTRARLASLIAEEPNPSKAKTEQKNPRERRGRAPTDADIARSNSGMSPGTANAIGTIIGVGMGVGLNNIGRRSSSGTSPGGAAATAPRHGTFDGPPR